MAFGDIGGTVTELILTCRTPDAGEVDIAKGDALKLTGPYTVSNAADDEDPIFGEALAEAEENAVAIPVKVRGVSVFSYVGAAPAVDGAAGIVLSQTDGQVKAPAAGNGRGLNLKVDEAAFKVHVLL